MNPEQTVICSLPEAFCSQERALDIFQYYWSEGVKFIRLEDGVYTPQSELVGLTNGDNAAFKRALAQIKPDDLALLENVTVSDQDKLSAVAKALGLKAGHYNGVLAMSRSGGITFYSPKFALLMLLGSNSQEGREARSDLGLPVNAYGVNVLNLVFSELRGSGDTPTPILKAEKKIVQLRPDQPALDIMDIRSQMVDPDPQGIFCDAGMFENPDVVVLAAYDPISKRGRTLCLDGFKVQIHVAEMMALGQASANWFPGRNYNTDNPIVATTWEKGVAGKMVAADDLFLHHQVAIKQLLEDGGKVRWINRAHNQVADDLVKFAATRRYSGWVTVDESGRFEPESIPDRFPDIKQRKAQLQQERDRLAAQINELTQLLTKVDSKLEKLTALEEFDIDLNELFQ